MGKCRKGKSEVSEKTAVFECKKCGALTDKKSHVCKPHKVQSWADGDDKKKKKKKPKA